MPAFEGSDGTLLTESNAIAYYVANEELRGGADAAARAEVRLKYLCLLTHDLSANLNPLLARVGRKLKNLPEAGCLGGFGIKQICKSTK